MSEHLLALLDRTKGTAVGRWVTRFCNNATLPGRTKAENEARRSQLDADLSLADVLGIDPNDPQVRASLGEKHLSVERGVLLGAIERRQEENLRSITMKALDSSASNDDTAEPPASTDWLYDFFSFAKDVNDEDFHVIWAHLLAQEASAPGTVSKRTLVKLREMDSSDATFLRDNILSIACRTEGDAFIWVPMTAMEAAHNNVEDARRRIGLPYHVLLKAIDLGFVHAEHLVRLHLGPRISFEARIGLANKLVWTNETDSELAIPVIALTQLCATLLNALGVEASPTYLELASGDHQWWPHVRIEKP